MFVKCKERKIDDSCITWTQGQFINSQRFGHWTEVERAVSIESLLVRPYPRGNAICKCSSPENAKWIAERLNFASKLERLFEEQNKT